MITNGLVKARIAAFENMDETSSFVVRETPIQAHSVKKLIRFFETEVSEKKSEREASTLKLGAGDEDIDEPFSSDSHESCEKQVEEAGEDTINTVYEDSAAKNVTLSDKSESDMEIQPNTPPTRSTTEEYTSKEEENPFVFHVNAPATSIPQERKDNAKRRKNKKRSLIKNMIAKGLTVLKISRRKTENENIEKRAVAQEGNEPPHRMKMFEERKVRSTMSKLIAYLSRRQKSKECSLNVENLKEDSQISLIPVEMNIPIPKDGIKCSTVKSIRLAISGTATLKDPSFEELH